MTSSYFEGMQNELADYGYNRDKKKGKKQVVLQLELFDDALGEAEADLSHGVERLVFRRNPTRMKEMAKSSSQRRAKIQEKIKQSNEYLQGHSRASLQCQYKAINAKIQKLKLSKHCKIQINEDERTLQLIVDNEALKEEQKLNGCYVLRTDLKDPNTHSKDLINKRYKDLAKVERGFRTLKSAYLELRPWFVVKEENTKAHAFTAMMSLKIIRFLENAWSEFDITVEEGIRELDRICILEIENKHNSEKNEFLPNPNPFAKKLLDAAGVKLPNKIQKPKVVVGTKTKLQAQRKSSQS